MSVRRTAAAVLAAATTLVTASAVWTAVAANGAEGPPTSSGPAGRARSTSASATPARPAAHPVPRSPAAAADDRPTRPQVRPLPPTAGGAGRTTPGRIAYLTFDDGPDPRWTPQVLGLLARYDAHATFFEIGTQAAAHPDLVRQVRAAGHRIGGHSWDHSDLTRLTPPQLADQLDRTAAALGEAPRCVRPPFGAVDRDVRTAVTSRGESVALWDVDTRDWTRPGAKAIAAEVISHTKQGSVILMHDGGGDRSHTVQALDQVLRRLSSKGYRFEPLPDC
ncbi:polysaccharide deacetylase family protein [Luteipulveratus sp. YIM 133132]|uniref:polysaccharide deacetylase family protein n=1 Tax=Luteipulveratus flavus TaxID=3031728 RepID=UPI0023B1D0DC|nr:polysaccharide deacetylase family protein [Luteipulveratus sp. YIM 133132]MDE9364879.1 polysaccharide deacetylase family protein [Luteipulveratus sp. YIM 133132]